MGLTTAALAEREARYSDLLRIASAEIDWLYELIGGSGFALILSDAHGGVLYAKTDEATLNTSHFAPSGFAVPIHDPIGEPIAALDASVADIRHGPMSQPHTVTLVSLAAQAIEKCLFAHHFKSRAMLRFHSRPELVNLQHDGTLVLHSDATIIAADASAVRLLGVANRHDIIGSRVDELFDTDAGELLRSAASRGALIQLRARSGQDFFACLDKGTGRSNLPPNVASLEPQPAHVSEIAPANGRKAAPLLDELAGADPQMIRNVRSARRIAASRVPVMILGATGTGKGAFARALHLASGRPLQSFVALNCAAIPESLIESELFGYRPGAFTGARKEGMKGKILQSSGGTLFLDEIGDMPLALQTRLLRVLEDQEVVPLGAGTPIHVDLHVTCASHQNLREMISRGLFREDLYYRLKGFSFELPALAQRADKEQLIRHFLAAETSDGRPAAIERDAFACLLAYGWPGNIRELRNVIRTALAICDGGVVRSKDLPSEVRLSVLPARPPVSMQPGFTLHVPVSDTPPAWRVTRSESSSLGPLEAAQRAALLGAIRESGGNMSRAASVLGVSRNTLYRRCKRLGLPLHRNQDLIP